MDELRQQIAAAHAVQERESQVARAQLDAALARGNYAKTVCLLRAIKSGAVHIDQVVIDGDTWQVLDTPPAPAPAPEG